MRASLQAKKVRDAGMAQADEGAGDEWRNHVDEVIREVAAERPFLTADNIFSRLDYEAHEMRAMGPAMKRARKRGLIKPTSHFIPCKRVNQHACPRRVWESMIFRPATEAS